MMDIVICYFRVAISVCLQTHAAAPTVPIGSYYNARPRSPTVFTLPDRTFSKHLSLARFTFSDLWR